jgi:hypothetical protein
MLPFSQWASVATNTFDPIGGFSFANDPALPEEFFVFQSP